MAPKPFGRFSTVQYTQIYSLAVEDFLNKLIFINYKQLLTRIFLHFWVLKFILSKLLKKCQLDSKYCHHDSKYGHYDSKYCHCDSKYYYCDSKKYF